MRRGFAQNRCKICSICNNNKMCKKTLNYLGVNVSENLIVSFNFFRSNSPLKFWESCRHFKRHNNCFLFWWTVIEWFVKTGYIPEATWCRMPQSSGIFMYWTCYVNRVDIEKVLDEFSSKKVRSKFFSKRFLCQNTFVIYIKYVWIL